MASQEQVISALRTCYDPEIPVNIYDLGLIYDVAVDEGIVDIRMTFTSDSCPSAREIPLDMRQKVGKIEGIKEVNLAVVWDPPWHPRMISEDARRELGIDDESLED